MRKKTIISTLATLVVAVAGAVVTLDLADRKTPAEADTVVSEPLPSIPRPLQPPATTTPTPTTTPSPSTSTTTTTVPDPPAPPVQPQSLRRGDSGPAVAELQRRLRGTAQRRVEGGLITITVRY